MGLAAVLDREVEFEEEPVSKFDYFTAMVA
jgi:hypothetical protein